MWTGSQNPLDPRQWQFYKEQGDPTTGTSFFVVPLFFSAILGIFICEPGSLNHLFLVIGCTVLGIVTRRLNDLWTFVGVFGTLFLVIAWLGVPIWECGKKLYHDSQVEQKKRDDDMRAYKERHGAH
jgi:hypothetical protein